MTFLQLLTIFIMKVVSNKHERKSITLILITMLHHYFYLLPIDALFPSENKVMGFMGYLRSFFYNSKMPYQIYRTYITLMLICILNLRSWRCGNLWNLVFAFVFCCFWWKFIVITRRGTLLYRSLQHYSYKRNIIARNS